MTDTELEPRHVSDCVCLGCGCLCDDIDVTVANEKIVAAERACELGRAWFLDRPATAAPVCLIAGQPASFEAGIERAARILIQARRPLVCGLTQTTCEAQRAAVALADWIGAAVDPSSGNERGALTLAMQQAGLVTSTLGEIRNRADVLIFWRADPVATHPRFFERYSLDAPGMFLPGGRTDRYCVVIDVERTATAERADLFLPITPDSDFASFSVLRALVQGLTLDAPTVQRQTGMPWEVWQELSGRMLKAHYGALVLGGPLLQVEPISSAVHTSQAAIGLMRELNAHTRFVCHALRGPGNPAGAENVLAWRTGYPLAVDFARGYPRYSPGEWQTASLLSRGEVDAALVVGGSALDDLPEKARDYLTGIPRVIVDHEPSVLAPSADVAFHTSAPGIHVGGTFFRADDVPLPLRAIVPSPLPSDQVVLEALEQRVRQLLATQATAL